MNTKLLVTGFAGLNVLLLVVTGGLSFLLRDLEGAKRRGLERMTGAVSAFEEALRGFRSETVRLAAERARMSRQLAEVRGELQERAGSETLSSVEPNTDSQPFPEDSQMPADPDLDTTSLQRFYRALERLGIEDRPDPAAIRLLDDTELERLESFLKEIPPLSDAALREGDIGEILRDPGWNPEARALAPAEREELRQLVSDYRYYTEYSHTERFHRYVRPELGRMRETGAYVEFGPGEPREPVKEAVASHMVLRGDGYSMYYLFPEDHPDLAHHKQVENQRSLEVYARIYCLMNGIDMP